MAKEILSQSTKNNLLVLKKAGILKNFYLAGGTGLALQLRHRLSLDLGFFTPQDINPQSLIQRMKRLGNFSVSQEAHNTLEGIFEKTRLTFLTYEYPLLFPLKTKETIKVADSRDIGCMKISAISSRGTKKDFIDLFFICHQIISLKKLLKLFEKKYQSVNYNLMHILKSLSYFEDAEKDPLPQMLIPVSWKEVKEFFKQEVKKNL